MRQAKCCDSSMVGSWLDVASAADCLRRKLEDANWGFRRSIAADCAGAPRGVSNTHNVRVKTKIILPPVGRRPAGARARVEVISINNEADSVSVEVKNS